VITIVVTSQKVKMASGVFWTWRSCFGSLVEKPEGWSNCLRIGACSLVFDYITLQGAKSITDGTYILVTVQDETGNKGYYILPECLALYPETEDSEGPVDFLVRSALVQFSEAQRLKWTQEGQVLFECSSHSDSKQKSPCLSSCYIT
jgi:hypothetical protein